jgi:hypothetical protein
VQETVRVTASATGEERAAQAGEGAALEMPPSQPVQRQRLQAPPGAVLYRIAANGTARILWESREDVPLALALGTDGAPIVATGDAGKLYRIDDEGRAAVVARSASEQASALASVRGGESVIIGGTRDARIERIAFGHRATGSYSTASIDAGTTARWGRVSWLGDVPRGGAVRVEARVGPERRDALPPARWMQLRFVLSAAQGGASPVVRRVDVTCAPQNRAPIVSAVGVEPPGVVWSRTPGVGTRAVAVADDPVTRRSTSALEVGARGGPVRKTYEPGTRTFTWQALDPDGDRLSYRVEIRREGTQHWIPIARDVTDDFFSWDARGMPDGTYRTRVIASDATDNAPTAGLSEQRTSPSFELDNTRPLVERPHVEGGGTGVSFVARDPGGQVAAVEVAVDGRSWQPVLPLDGVADSVEERYAVEIEPPAADETDAVLVDAAGNLGGDVWTIEP